MSVGVLKGGFLRRGFWQRAVREVDDDDGPSPYWTAQRLRRTGGWGLTFSFCADARLYLSTVPLELWRRSSLLDLPTLRLPTGLQRSTTSSVPPLLSLLTARLMLTSLIGWGDASVRIKTAPFYSNLPPAVTSLVRSANPPPVHKPSSTIEIRLITDVRHPAFGQRGLFAKKKLTKGELVVWCVPSPPLLSLLPPPLSRVLG